MINPPDHLLRTGLSLNESGHDLAHGLRLGTYATIHKLAQQKPWANVWHTKMASASSRPFGAQVMDDCFCWIFDPSRRWFRSALAQEVSERVLVATTPAAAVASALLEREDVRVREAIFHRWCLQGQRLYRPEQVRPFLALALRGMTSNVHHALVSLARWVEESVQYVSDQTKWGRPDLWQAPMTTLRDGSGDCEDMALVVWSAAPLVGLPRGRLVIGTVDGEGHAWVEFPELGLWVEATSGDVGRLAYGTKPGRYRAWMYLYPDGQCIESGLNV